MNPQPLPVKFLRIDCHVAANANYSISIWHLFLEGYSPQLHSLSALPSASDLVSLYESHRHACTTRLILAHLRRSGPAYLPAFRTLLSTLSSDSTSGSDLRLEHPLLAALHESLVLRGDWDASERLLDQLLAAGLLDEWDGRTGGTKGQTVAKWQRIGPPSEKDAPAPNGKSPSEAWPCGRGGHAMVRVGRKILMYGGWDGRRELGDMWEYDLPLNVHDTASPRRWRLLQDGLSGAGTGPGGASDAKAGAVSPGPRSCHQMVVDERDGWVYVLGARRDELDEEDADTSFGSLADSGARRSDRGAGGMDVDDRANVHGEGAGVPSGGSTLPTEDRWKSDFWRYKAAGPDRGKWELLSEDTRRDGGPALL